MSSDNICVVQAPKQSGQVPVNSYLALFKGIEDYKLKPSGEVKWRFVWEVCKGEHKGQLATSLCDRAIRPGTLAGNLIAGLLSLLGESLTPGQDVGNLISSTCAVSGPPWGVG